MKEHKNIKGKTASAKLSANRKASGKKSVTAKAEGKEIRINYVAEITKIKNKLIEILFINHRVVNRVVASNYIVNIVDVNYLYGIIKKPNEIGFLISAIFC